MKKTFEEETIRGPGYKRMQARLGKAGMEALRLDTYRLQNLMREIISEGLRRDRDTYQDYPPARRRKK